MLRFADQPLGNPGFHHGSVVENHDKVTDMICRGQVVGDVKDGDAQVLVELVDFFQDRGAQAGIDHRDGFICHQQLGLQDQRPGYRNALALSTAELVRVATQGLFRAQADPPQGIFHDLAGFIGFRGDIKIFDGDGKQVVYFIEGVVNREGVLENRLRRCGEN